MNFLFSFCNCCWNELGSKRNVKKRSYRFEKYDPVFKTARSKDPRLIQPFKKSEEPYLGKKGRIYEEAR